MKRGKYESSSKRKSYVALCNTLMLVIAIIVVLSNTKTVSEERDEVDYTHTVIATSTSSRVVNTAEAQVLTYNGTEPEVNVVEVTHPTSLICEEPEPKNYVDLTDDEIYELATLVFLEAGGESFECQCAVASVVVNRMTESGEGLDEVIYKKNQFTPAYLISSSSPSDSTLEATLKVIQYGPTIPEYVTYFRADYFFDWVTPYINIDHTYFSYDKNLAERLGY